MKKLNRIEQIDKEPNLDIHQQVAKQFVSTAEKVIKGKKSSKEDILSTEAKDLAKDIREMENLSEKDIEKGKYLNAVDKLRKKEKQKKKIKIEIQKFKLSYFNL